MFKLYTSMHGLEPRGLINTSLECNYLEIFRLYLRLGFYQQVLLPVISLACLFFLALCVGGRQLSKAFESPKTYIPPRLGLAYPLIFVACRRRKRTYIWGREVRVQGDPEAAHGLTASNSA